MTLASFQDAGVQGVRLTKKKRIIKGVPRVAGTHAKESYWIFQGLSVELEAGDGLVLVSRDPDRSAGPMLAWAGLLPVDTGQMSAPARCLLLTSPQSRWVRELSVEQTIRMLAGIYGLTDDEVDDVVAPAAKLAQVDAKMHWPIQEMDKGVRDQIAFAVAVNAPVPVVMFDQTAQVGIREFRPLCLPQVNTLREQGKAVVLATAKPQVALDAGSKAVILRGKRSQPVSVAEAAEFLIKDRVKGRRKARRRAEEDDDDSGLEF